MNKILQTSLITVSILTSVLSASNTLATVNGTAINEDKVTKYLEKIEKIGDATPSSNAKKAKLLDHLIERELFSQKAIKEGVDKSEAFQKDLIDVKKDLLVRSWIDKIHKNIHVNDSEIEAIYLKQKSQYSKPEKVKARHILIKSEKKAEELLKKLSGLKGSELKSKFIELAKKHSTGPSARKGGDLGWFTKGRMVPKFEEASFSMNINEVSKKPVKTRFGYHILYKEGSKAAEITPLSEVKESIVLELKNKKFSKKFDKIKKDLKEEATIKYIK